MIEFKLNAVEEERAEVFYKKCKRKTKGKDVHISYHFYPTGIGTTIKIKNETLDVEENITDLSCW